jgi:hypothetical protein
MKFDFDEVSSGAALSRASSASLGFSFSFTGFTMPPDEIADSKPFSDDDIRKSLFINVSITFNFSFYIKKIYINLINQIKTPSSKPRKPYPTQNLVVFEVTKHGLQQLYIYPWCLQCHLHSTIDLLGITILAYVELIIQVLIKNIKKSNTSV